MRIDSKTAAARLLEMDDITLLCHRDPDGDTYGSASALFDALSAMGKRVNIRCPDLFPANLAYLHREMPRFETKHFVAIDMAARRSEGNAPCGGAEYRPPSDQSAFCKGNLPLQLCGGGRGGL